MIVFKNVTRCINLHRLKNFLQIALWIVFLQFASTYAQKLPSKPERYFTDQAHVVDGVTANTINQKLEDFERVTSNQILVAIYPKLPDGAEVAQYSIDTFNSWKVGQKGKDNGAILFVFVKDHKMFICTGRGLEGALPDAICKSIITHKITPQFKQGDYADGIIDGIDAMFAATRGEYQGTGQTKAEEQGSDINWVILLIFFIFLIISLIRNRGFGGPVIFTGGGYGGGWGGGSGGGFFSGGGGSSAGGGAGGSW
jgi:uncharacterized protein